MIDKIQAIFKSARINREVKFKRITRKSDTEFGYVVELEIGNGNGNLVLSLTLKELKDILEKGTEINSEIYRENWGVPATTEHR